MEKNRRRKITLKSSVPITAVFVLLSSFLFPLSPTSAFTGPSQGVGSGSGAIGSDAANNVSVGTSTTKAETKFLVVASSTDTTNYAVKILDSGQGSLLIVRNDGSVGVATSGLTYTLNVGGNIYASGNVTCGGSCGAGNVAAANITAGGFNFAQSTTTGDFAFPASLGIGTSTTVSLPVGFTAYQTSTFFGKVGIGSTPLSKLDVNGGVAIGTYAGANAAPSNGLIVSGNLGVGTTNTTAKLEVNGVIGDDIQGNNQYYLNSVGSNYGFLMNNTTGVWSLGYGTSPGTLGTSVLTWNASGNVGIGTTQPSSTLHVVGGVQVTANVTTTNLTITGLTSQNCLGTSNTGAVQAGTCTGTGGSGTVTTSTVVTANYFPFWNSTNGSGLNGTSSIYQSSLNIGIGTLQPSSTLHIVGGSIIINGTNGGLAVGTTTVQSVGNIYATGNITTAGSFSGNIAATNVTAGTFAGASNFSFPSGLGIATSGTALPVAGLNVYATSSFLLGNVGVGTAQPSSTLHVVGGDVMISGTGAGLSVGTTTSANAGSVLITGNVTTTNLTITGVTSQNCLGTNSSGVVQAGTCTGSGGSGTVTTSTVVTANYFPFWNSTNGSGLNGTSSIYQSGLSVGIGTTQPSSTLHIVGNLFVSGSSGQATTTRLSITGLAGQTGCLSVNSTGYVVTSTCSGAGSVPATNITPGAFNNGTAGNFSFPSGLGIATSGTALPVGGLNVYAASSFLLGNVRIGNDPGAGTSTVLLGTASTTKQSASAFGPEAITFSAPGSNRRVLLWAGQDSEANGKFLMDNQGFLEWGAGGANDQDSSLSRDSTGIIALINPKGFMVGQPGGQGELLRINNTTSTTSYVVEINGAGGAATLDINSVSSSVPTIRAQQLTASSNIFGGYVNGDPFLRYSITAKGTTNWGSGNASSDISLFRNASGSLIIQGINGVSSTAAFAVLNPAGGTVFNVDTINSRVGIGNGISIPSSANLDITGNANGNGLAALRVSQPLASDISFGFFVAGDAQLRYVAKSDGTIQWGPGTATGDTQLYRPAASSLALIGLPTAANIFVGIGTASPAMTLDVNGSSTFRNHINTTGTVPTVSKADTSTATGCGTGATITGTDSAGRIVTGGTVTNAADCRVTFALAYPNVPSCVLTLGSSSLATLTMRASTTASMLDILFSSTSNTSTIIFYHCIGL